MWGSLRLVPIITITTVTLTTITIPLSQLCYEAMPRRWSSKVVVISETHLPHSLVTQEQVKLSVRNWDFNHNFFPTSGLGPRHYTVHLRAILLLQFMEHLDKLMYNAYEGSCVTLPLVPKVLVTHETTSTCDSIVHA